ncbi:MAG TPA: HIT domain-containing protein [Bacteroidota bacterium]|nr:HIT domain-containing protein [Bacteroidota bacterium]
MDRLYSPWRSRYIATFKDEKKNEGASLFTRVAGEKNDTKNLVLARRKHCFVMMNLYPYNSGHLMVVPYKKTSDLADLSPEEQLEIMQTTTEMIELLKKTLKPHGFNFGSNLGRVAGAGIDDHIHFHIVPRWNGDMNFMPTIADTKVVSESMRDTYKRLKKNLAKKK